MGDQPMGFHVPPGNAPQGSQYPPPYSTVPNANDGMIYKQIQLYMKYNGHKYFFGKFTCQL